MTILSELLKDSVYDPALTDKRSNREISKQQILNLLWKFLFFFEKQIISNKKEKWRLQLKKTTNDSFKKVILVFSNIKKNKDKDESFSKEDVWSKKKYTEVNR